jgi:hypothetical protein
LLSSVSKHSMWSHYATTYCVYWRKTTTINPMIIRPHIVFTNGRQQRQPNHNKLTQYVVVLWLGLLLLSSVSKHNMWSYYDWVYCCCPSVKTICDRIMIGFIVVVVLTDDNNNSIIIRPHIVFTNGQQQRQPNHNTTNIVFTDGHWVYCCFRPSVNTICGRIMIGLSLLSSVSKHNMWSCYDWVVVVVVRQ